MKWYDYLELISNIIVFIIVVIMWHNTLYKAPEINTVSKINSKMMFEDSSKQLPINEDEEHEDNQ
jgi:hypothetical protein